SSSTNATVPYASRRTSSPAKTTSMPSSPPSPASASNPTNVRRGASTSDEPPGEEPTVMTTVHLLDGTYELFRHHYGQPRDTPAAEMVHGATRGVLMSVLGLLAGGATHLGVATDHVIESFRNDLWPGYKTSEGMEPVLLAQFGDLEA